MQEFGASKDANQLILAHISVANGCIRELRSSNRLMLYKQRYPRSTVNPPSVRRRSNLRLRSEEGTATQHGQGKFPGTTVEDFLHLESFFKTHLHSLTCADRKIIPLDFSATEVTANVTRGSEIFHPLRSMSVRASLRPANGLCSRGCGFSPQRDGSHLLEATGTFGAVKTELNGNPPISSPNSTMNVQRRSLVLLRMMTGILSGPPLGTTP